jgi:hypothetical protein
MCQCANVRMIDQQLIQVALSIRKNFSLGSNFIKASNKRFFGNEI